MISDYTLNTLLQACISSNWLRRQMVTSSKELTNIVARFEEAFGESDTIAVFLNPIEHNVKVGVLSRTKEMVSQVRLLLHIQIDNPFSTERSGQMDAVTADVEILAKVRFDVSPEMLLTGETLELKTKVANFRANFFTYTTKESFAGQIEILSPIFTSYLNSLLHEGIELPIPEWIQKSINDPFVEAMNGFLLLTGQPQNLS